MTFIDGFLDKTNHVWISLQKKLLQNFQCKARCCWTCFQCLRQPLRGASRKLWTHCLRTTTSQTMTLWQANWLCYPGCSQRAIWKLLWKRDRASWRSVHSHGRRVEMASQLLTRHSHEFFLGVPVSVKAENHQHLPLTSYELSMWCSLYACRLSASGWASMCSATTPNLWPASLKWRLWSAIYRCALAYSGLLIVEPCSSAVTRRQLGGHMRGCDNANRWVRDSELHSVVTKHCCNTIKSPWVDLLQNVLQPRLAGPDAWYIAMGW